MKAQNKWWKTLLKVTAWLIGIWAVLLVSLQVTLSEKVLTKLVNKYAAEYIEGDLSFGSASVSMFKRFPRVFLTLEDFSVTYPSDRFEQAEKEGIQSRMIYHGSSETADTLASFDRFSVSLDLAHLMGGTIRILHMRLVRPRIFAHSYANGEANWDIFKFSTEEEEIAEDSSTFALPRISLGRVSLSKHPHIVYTDSKDTVFAMIDIARIGFTGKINTTQTSRKNSKFTPRNTTKGLTVDSLLVAGRVKQDTVRFIVEKFYIQENDDLLDIDAKARAMLATNSFGRIYLPIGITGKLDFPKDSVPAVTLTDLKANVGDFPFVADADVRFMDGKANVKAKAGIKNCKLNDVFHGFAKNIIPELEKVETNAKLTMLAECDGEYIYSTGKFPKISASISLPDASLRYSDLEELEMKFGFKASGNTDSRGRVNASIDKMDFTTEGVNLGFKGGAKDILGKDPSFNVDGNLNIILDSLVKVLPDTLGICAEGAISAELHGSALLSQMNIYNFSSSDIRGNIASEKITFQMPSDTIDLKIKGFDVTLAPEEMVSRRDSTRTRRLMGVTAKVNNIYLTYGDALSMQGKKLTASAKNSVSDSPSDTTRINPLSGRFMADLLIVKDAASTSLSLSETNNGFLAFPKKDQPEIPVLTLTSKNGKITLASGKSRAILSDANLRANATMNKGEEKTRTRQPRIRRENLIEDDFRDQDIDIRLDETMAKYFKEWDIKGNIGVRTGTVITPYFPLRNSLKGFDLNFTNNEVKVDSFKVVSGKSEIEAKGAITGLKGALLGRGRGTMNLNLDIASNSMDAGELMMAYQKGLLYVPTEAGGAEMSDAELLKMVTESDSLSASDTIMPLIVVPANLRADIRMNARNVKYTDLIADSLTSKILMKERCVQITETKAQTNMGAMTFDAFYSTRSKKDLKAGFDLNFEEITADKVINLVPAVDTLIPLLKSFSGHLNCEIAATTDLDTNMNLVMPSINGIMRISGKDLTIQENDTYRSLARMLMMKDKREGHIGDMTVEGVIQNNTVEIFPFVISMDRYKLALSGVQNLDMSYKYHASLIQSPFRIKLGVDVFGDDFDNMKFKIGKAKYKSENVPVFSAVIDETKINLLASIQNIFEKGVDAVIKDNMQKSAINKHMQSIGYVRAVDVKMEELSEKEQKELKDEEAKEEEQNTETQNIETSNNQQYE